MDGNADALAGEDRTQVGDGLACAGVTQATGQVLAAVRVGRTDNKAAGMVRAHLKAADRPGLPA